MSTSKENMDLESGTTMKSYRRTSYDNDSITFWMNGVLSLILVIFGLVCNTAVIVSFHYGRYSKLGQRRRQAFYYYLLTFAGWNMGMLLATILFNCIPTLVTNSGTISQSTLHATDICYVIGYLAGNCCITANVWLAVVLTIERYLAVSRPLRSRLSSPRRRAKLICAILSILVVLYNSPLVFELTFARYVDYDYLDDAIDYETIDGQNISVYLINENYTRIFYKLSLSSMRDNVYYQLIYRVLANFIFVSFVPFAIVLLLTVRIVCVVRDSNRRRARFRKPTISENSQNGAALNALPALTAPNSQSQSRYVDIVLTLIAIKFLLFYSLPVVINTVELTTDNHMFDIETSKAAKFLRFLVDISNLLVVLDGATNSFFYFSWRNRMRLYRFDLRSKSSYGQNLETRCGPKFSEYGIGALNENPVSSARRSKFEWPNHQNGSWQWTSSNDQAQCQSENPLIDKASIKRDYVIDEKTDS